MHAVTGAFGYTGRYVAERLLSHGIPVRTLTGSPQRDSPLQGQIEVAPFHFDDPAALTESLRGVEVLHNTYWVRFNYERFKHMTAVENTLRLFEAAEKAGVRRVVHVSISNADENSPLEYFAGKGRLERALQESGMSHAIVRPAVLFGGEDILINNIAWALRRLPVFGVFGDGSYGLRPVHVEDMADLMVELASGRRNVVVNAIGPEQYSYRGLIELLIEAIGVKRMIVNTPPRLNYWMGWALGKLMRDVMITREEIDGLMAGLLEVEGSPTGTTKLSTWIRAHADTLGRRYHSELARRVDRIKNYEML
ncbi:NAD(P)H-binding protein [Candidatus Sumerlaeota bacterium]|nr:NAD(P)H-binding protein [Candidatus Sumerlaeota bacterium]